MSRSKSRKGNALLLAAATVFGGGIAFAFLLAPAQPCLAAPAAWLDNENTFLDRGKRNYNSGQFDQALKDFSDCIRINPRRSEAFYWRSMVYSALKDNNSAISDLDQAIRVDANNPAIFLNRGLIYSNLGKNEAAVSDFDQALRLDSSLTDARQNRDFCLKEIEKAKAAPQKAAAPAQQIAVSTAAAGDVTAGGASSPPAVSGAYVPYTGKPSARLASLQREQKESEARLYREKAAAEKMAAERALAEEKNAEITLKEKEAEIRLETARSKREEAEAQRLAMAKAVGSPGVVPGSAKKHKGNAAANSQGQSADAPSSSNDGGDLDIVDRPVRDKWALVIGISEFKDQNLNLHYPAKDAKDFYNFLVSDGNFARDHVKLLVNEQATRDNIMEELGDTWLPHVANPDDLVLIYVSSHGSPAEMDKGGGGVNYLIAYDTDIEKLYATGVSMQGLTRSIKDRVHSERVVVVLDACHSGGAQTGAKGLTRTKNVDAEALAQGSGQLIISSSSPDQVSWESKKYENSVFTRCLIESLRKKGSATTLGEAFQNLKDQVQSQVLSERGVLQTPVLRSKWKGSDLLISAPAAAPQVGD